MSITTEQDLVTALAGIESGPVGPMSEEHKKALVCQLVGHSKIQTHFMGYWYCARCGDQLGDTLGGAYDPGDAVLVGHKCKSCVENYAKLDWRHRFMTPDPFPATETAEPAAVEDG